MKITPDTTLAAGTHIMVGNLHGTVISATMERAHPCGFVCVHKMQFTHKRVRKFGNNYKMVPIEPPKVGTANYSFIEVLA